MSIEKEILANHQRGGDIVDTLEAILLNEKSAGVTEEFRKLSFDFAKEFFDLAVTKTAQERFPVLHQIVGEEIIGTVDNVKEASEADLAEFDRVQEHLTNLMLEKESRDLRELIAEQNLVEKLASDLEQATEEEWDALISTLQ